MTPRSSTVGAAHAGVTTDLAALADAVRGQLVDGREVDAEALLEALSGADAAVVARRSAAVIETLGRVVQAALASRTSPAEAVPAVADRPVPTAVEETVAPPIVPKAPPTAAEPAPPQAAVEPAPPSAAAEKRTRATKAPVKRTPTRAADPAPATRPAAARPEPARPERLESARPEPGRPTAEKRSRPATPGDKPAAAEKPRAAKPAAPAPKPAPAEHEPPHRPARAGRGAEPTLAVADGEVQVLVPYPTIEQNSPWRVTVAGSTRTVRPDRAWGGTEVEQPPTAITVTEPARMALIRHASAEHRVSVVDSDDPLILFTLAGDRIPAGEALPRQGVLALYPRDGRVVGTGRAVVTVADTLACPLGWLGWTFARLDVAGHDAVGLLREDRPVGTTRRVRPATAPVVELGDPVDGVRSVAGLRVHAARPVVTVPEESGDVWTVRVRRVGEEAWQREQRAEPGATVDPFDGLTGLLGRFEVDVTGAEGLDQTVEVFLVEGLGIELDDEFRLPEERGLTAVDATLTSESVTIEPTSLQFTPQIRDLPVDATSDGRTERLWITPPHAQIRVESAGVPAKWRATAVAVRPEELAGDLVLAARVPGDVAVDIAVIDEEGEVAEAIVPDVVGDCTYLLDAVVLYRAARRAGECEIVARVDTVDGYELQMPIATVLPYALCEGVVLDGSTLVFEDLAAVDGLAAFVFSATAPWRPVERVEIADGVAQLPASLVGAGDLLVELFVNDPWTTTQRPSRPGPAAVRVEQDGCVGDDDPERALLSAFLSGEGPLPTEPGADGAAWTALVAEPTAAAGLVEYVGGHGRDALLALGEATATKDEIIQLAVRSGLLTSPFGTGTSTAGVQDSPNPWISSLLTLAELPGAADPGAALAALRERAGEPIIDLLTRGTVRDPRIGVMDGSSLMIAAMPPEQIDAIFGHSMLVPGALLDIDTRVTALVGAFSRRGEWVDAPEVRSLQGHCQAVLSKIKKSSRAVYDLVAARNEALDGIAVAELGKNPWLLLSVQSLVLAAVARLDARGLSKSPLFVADMLPGWGRMAQLFPDMVAADVLIADAVTAYEVSRRS